MVRLCGLRLCGGLHREELFSAGRSVTGLLATFLTYGLGFLARPLGGIILGRVGDTHGRKTALLITIALMAAGTV
jgi:MHS family proline/betaine transporter-like MFS transporter